MPIVVHNGLCHVAVKMKSDELGIMPVAWDGTMASEVPVEVSGQASGLKEEAPQNILNTPDAANRN